MGALLLSPLSLSSARAQSAGRPAARRQPPAKARPSKPSGQSNKQSGAAFDEAVKNADQAREAGRLDEALDLYGKALQMRPNWTEGWWYAGTILYDRDRYPDARDAFRNLVALEPKRAHAWGMLGLCEYQTREYDRAVNSLQRGRPLPRRDSLHPLRAVRGRVRHSERICARGARKSQNHRGLRPDDAAHAFPAP